MTDKIKYVKDIQIIKSEKESGILLIKAKGIAEINKLITPILVPGNNENLSEEGIYELNFTIDPEQFTYVTVELEMEVELRIKNLPKNVKALKIKASDNADIELIM